MKGIRTQSQVAVGLFPLADHGNRESAVGKEGQWKLGQEGWQLLSHLLLQGWPSYHVGHEFWVCCCVIKITL